MLNFDDKLVRIPMPIIATLAPSQDTTPDQLAAFYRQPGIPFTRHSPLPVAASAPTNALINSAKKLLILLALLLCASRASAAPVITVQASSVNILGTSQPISITVNLIDPNNTGMLSVAGTGIVPIMRATTVTPGTTATVGPIYGNDVILNGYGVANTTYYQVSVYTVNGSTISSTPSLQQFYALTGSGTIDLSTATPLAPSFMSSPTGVSIPGTLSVGGSSTFFGPLDALGGIVTTSLTLAGSATVLCQFNDISYVGGSCGTTWGGGDIGSQINGAYTLMPATGGTIYVLPQANGSCYLFQTTILLNTIGKYVRLVGTSPPQGNSGSTRGGSCLQWTPTTSNALIIDWNTTGNGTYVAPSAIQDILLTNSSTNGGSTPCTTNGGCGSLATGVQIGGTNGGAQMAEWRNFTVQGFGTGVSFAQGAGWSELCANCSITHNTVGWRFISGVEGMAFVGGNFSVNGTGVVINTSGNPAAVSFTGTHFDSNTVLGLDGSVGTCGLISFNSVHFENNQQTNVHYVNCGTGGTLAFHGVDAGDDSSSSSTDYWFGAGEMMGDLTVFSAGRTVTSLFVNTLLSDLHVINNSPTVLTGLLGLCGVSQNCSNVISSNSGTPISRMYLSQLNQAGGDPWAAVSACVGNAKTITFPTAYVFGAPVIQLTDYTTAGGIRMNGAVTASGFTVACTGATDVFSYTVIGNPY